MTDNVNLQSETPEEAQKPSLNLQDLVNVIQIISTCSQRGAFRAEELSGVGGLYDRLYAFLDSTGALKKPDSTPTTE